ncbi:hypothetical protein [Anabaena azotica]|uniref:Uncharacterized protein n=1 Tax=Anabaena azotica FACHB-119 TaxID=947527 RepID=A0ABR8D1S9_9NOST|nr:hypothetical protein [Anabaena azotica]MBD2501144.1 hypothetical protein [Anabaena azotica FACHB-119]
MGQVCTEKSSGFIPQFTQHIASPVDFSSPRPLTAWILPMQVNIAWSCDDRGDAYALGVVFVGEAHSEFNRYCLLNDNT